MKKILKKTLLLITKTTTKTMIKNRFDSRSMASMMVMFNKCNDHPHQTCKKHSIETCENQLIHHHHHHLVNEFFLWFWDEKKQKKKIPY